MPKPGDILRTAYYNYFVVEPGEYLLKFKGGKTCLMFYRHNPDGYVLGVRPAPEFNGGLVVGIVNAGQILPNGYPGRLGLGNAILVEVNHD